MLVTSLTFYSTWYCPAFGQVNLFRILFCWRASNKVIVSIWSLLIPVSLTWKPAFETLPSRFGHAVHLKTNACTKWWTIYVKNWSFTGGDNFLGMKSTKSELVSISILKRPNREYNISMLERIINTRSPTLTKWHWPGSECRRPVCPPWARPRRWPARQPRCWSPLWSGVRSSCRCLLSAPPAKSRGRTSEIGEKW